MRPLRYSPLVALAAFWLAPAPALPADATAVPPAPPSAPSRDRLVISGNGSTLTGATGGGGGSLSWLHSFDAGVVGVGGEYQKLADAHWEFGSLSGSVSTGGPSARWTLSGQVHLGSGDIAVATGERRFNYDVEDVGVTGTFASKLIVQLEAQQFDIDKTHGAMPKIALGLLWTPHLQTTVSYSRSVTGNLGTELESLRIDHYGSLVNWLIGGAAGHVAPPVVNIYTGLTGAAPQLREGYLGLSKSFSRTDWSILADYLKVASERRITLTVVCTLHVGGSAT